MRRKEEQVGKRKLGLTTIIFMSLLVRAITGVLMHYCMPSGFIKDTLLVNGIFYFVGNGFLRGMQCFVVYMVMLKVCTGLNPFTFIKKFLPVMGFAFSAATSNASIPLSIETLDKKWVFQNVFHFLLFHLVLPLIWMEQLLCKA